MATAREDVEHLLRRVGFGGTAAEIDALTPYDWSDVVDRVLDTSAAPSPSAGAPSLPFDTTDWASDYNKAVHFWLDRCATTPTPIVEKMTLFWHGHLTSSTQSVKIRWMFDQNQIFRTHGLGKFDELVQLVSIDPAMLHYLGNRSSHRWNPNENFARELLELFTLGVGNYTEDDVRAAARAWTGHTIGDDNRYAYRAHWHDDEVKSFMGIDRAWTGPEIIDHVLHGPKRRTAARFLTRKLWEFFAYENPAHGLVASLADEFLAADLDVTSLVRAILLRPEFRSSTARNGRLRSPIEYAVAIMRYTGFDCSVVRPEWSLPDMGMRPFAPPSVEGWEYNLGFVSTASAWGRASLVDRVGWLAKQRGLMDAVPELGVHAAVDHVLDMFGITATWRTRSIMIDFLESVRSDRTWAQGWGLTSLALTSPEFQLA